MTLLNSSTEIYCQTCANGWPLGDDKGEYYFRSDLVAGGPGTFAIGDYASPAAIVAAGERMSFCPKCDVEQLAEPYKKPAPGIQESPFFSGDSRMRGETEQDIRTRDGDFSQAKGSPDVTHEP